MNPYLYQDNTAGAIMSVSQETGNWTRYSVHFPTGVKAHRIEDNRVMGEYYQPRIAGTTPLVILVHGMGDLSTVPCRVLARALAKNKIACFVLYLVTHSVRVPESMKNRVAALTTDEWLEVYQLSVTDILQIIDWASNRREIDSSKIAVFGISLGGFISAITMAVDKRIKAGVMVVTGGNTEKMARLSKNENYRNQHSESEYQEIQRCYADYLTAVAIQGFENVVPPRQGFLIDPLTYASYLRDRPVLMFNAWRDKYIPQETALDFWRACGKPAIRWFPTGHSSIWLFYPAIRKQMLDFLSQTFSK
ncbi:MAG: alpha/beta hydrolase family protein [Dehalococcoidales bacterium]|nr:alpha/beta hydrolase family protein [Dehalococcoidales bacterium]